MIKMSFVLDGLHPGTVHVEAERENIDVIENDSVTLQCLYNTLSHKHFAVHWYKTKLRQNGQPDLGTGALKIWTSDILHDQASHDFTTSIDRANPEIPVQTSHSIQIKNATQNDESVYVCELELNFGKKKGFAHIRVNVLSKCISVVLFYFQLG